MSEYTPSNWYWYVAGDQSQAYSSVIGDFVQASDPTFQAWIAAGNTPTKIASNAELGAVLAPYSLRPSHAGVLDGYLNAQVNELTVATVAKVCFNHENRLRVLEGKAQVSAQQFLTVLKGLM